MPKRVIALLIILTHFLSMLPAQEFGVDLRRGYNRLENYLDRAALERSAQSWEALATAGLEAALLEWESANILLKESDRELWTRNREEAGNIYRLEVERAYIEWASRRIHEERVHLESSALAAEIRRAAGEMTYIREDGSRANVIDLSKAGEAREAWEKLAAAIVDSIILKLFYTVLGSCDFGFFPLVDNA